MKNTIILCIGTCLLVSTMAFSAPFSKSSKLIDGKSDLRFSINDDYKDINLGTSVAYFINNQVALGGIVNIDYYTRKNWDYTFYGLGPILYFFWERTPNKTYPYISGSITVNGNSNNDNSSTNLSLSAGIAYMLNSAIALSPELYFSNVSSDGSGDTVFGIQMGITGFLK